MGHLPRQTLLLEDIAVDTFGPSSFGTVVMTLFQDIFTAPSWQVLYINRADKESGLLQIGP
jgi:hypothetical protein